MLKYFFITCFAILQCGALKAQHSTTAESSNNPLDSVEFLNRPLKTLTLTASYAHSFGSLNENSLGMLQSINSIYGLDVTKFHYSIALKLDGNPQIFEVPCRDENLYHLLSANENAVSRLKLTCVVYRFYTLDGSTNFFYVDKAVPAAN